MATVVSTSPDASPRAASQLQRDVARSVGGEEDQPVLDACLSLLNEQIRKFNSRLYECNRVETGVLSIVNGADASIGALFFKEEGFYLCDSAGVRSRQLPYIDLQEYYNVFNLTSASGGPIYYTIVNGHASSKIRLLPAIAASPASTIYIAGLYYKRFATLASPEAILDAPQEIENALVYGAQAEAIATYASLDTQKLARKTMEAAEAWSRFVVSDSAHPNKHKRFRLAPLANRTAYTTF